MNALNTQFAEATVDNQQPTVALTTRTLLEAYHALLQPQQRFSESDKASGGFSNLLYRGIGCYADSHCPANHWFFVNEDVVKLYVHRDENMRFDPFMKRDDQARDEWPLAA